MYEEQGQGETRMDEPYFLNIRPSTEESLDEVDSEGDDECDDEGLFTTEGRVKVANEHKYMDRCTCEESCGTSCDNESRKRHSISYAYGICERLKATGTERTARTPFISEHMVRRISDVADAEV